MLWLAKIVDHTLFLDVRDKKRVRVLAGQKGADLSRCVRDRIAMVNNDSSSLDRLRNFSEKIVVYHSELTVLRCSSETVAT